MSKKLIILTVVICLGLIAGLRSMRAQTDVQGEDISGDLETINKKLDTVLSGLKARENTDKAISGKLDLVLSNQDKILKELEIVKVRASRR